MSSQNDEKNLIKGVKISHVNFLIIIMSFILCMFFIFDTIKVKQEYNNIEIINQNYLECQKEAKTAKEGSYYLTEQVHLFVSTEEVKYAENYFKEVNITKRRENAMQELKSRNISVSTYSSLLSAMDISNKLMEREIYAIRLIAEAKGDDISDYDKSVGNCELSREDTLLSAQAKRELAHKLVFGDEYVNYRDSIDEEIQSFIDEALLVSENSKAQVRVNLMNLIGLQFVFIVFLFLINVVFFIMINKLIVKPLKIYMKCIREGRTFETLGAYEFKYLALTYNNIFEINHENEKMLRHKADHDDMTGLINKGAFKQISEQYIGKDVAIALLIIDIDKFKTVNDTYGHAIGDEIIKSVAVMLSNSFRSSDYVARIGGDEFSVIMNDVTKESTESIQHIIENLNNALQNPKRELPKASCSVGAAFSECGYSNDLFNNADKALYITKKNGRCGCSFSDDVIKKE